jgi:hypothetical protein
LSQEQVPSLHIQHLPNRLRFTLQQKIARAAHYHTDVYEVQKLWLRGDLVGVSEVQKLWLRGALVGVSEVQKLWLKDIYHRSL